MFLKCSIFREKPPCTTEDSLPAPRDEVLFDIEMALRKEEKLWPKRYRPATTTASGPSPAAFSSISNSAACGSPRRPPAPGHSTPGFPGRGRNREEKQLKLLQCHLPLIRNRPVVGKSRILPATAPVSRDPGSARFQGVSEYPKPPRKPRCTGLPGGRIAHNCTENREFRCMRPNSGLAGTESLYRSASTRSKVQVAISSVSMRATVRAAQMRADDAGVDVEDVPVPDRLAHGRVAGHHGAHAGDRPGIFPAALADLRLREPVPYAAPERPHARPAAVGPVSCERPPPDPPRTGGRGRHAPGLPGRAASRCAPRRAGRRAPPSRPPVPGSSGPRRFHQLPPLPYQRSRSVGQSGSYAAEIPGASASSISCS